MNSYKVMRTSFYILLLSGLATVATARENTSIKVVRSPYQKTAADPCDAGKSSVDLDINNVRAKLLSGGDFWWDISKNPQVASYEVPKVVAGTGISRSSIYSGALWFGGYAPGKQLRISAQTYGHAQGNLNFWPGPLDTTAATITKEECGQWDRHFKVNRTDIDAYLAGKAKSAEAANVVAWPGYKNKSLPFLSNPNPAITKSLAPFVDVDGNGEYDTQDNPSTEGIVEGNDYPDFKGDQAIWWVFNDKGGVPGQYTPVTPMGIEVQALAFAFKTNDELNNMTFYTYKIVNRTQLTLDSTYMALFVDADLGDYSDDYIGCDAELGVGYIYNGDDNDGTNLGYGENPPALGVDYFQGPIDENGKQLPMTNFMYFNNGNDNTQTDPTSATQVYDYMRSRWKDGTRLTYGNTGYSTSSTNYSNFAFPGKTDPKKRPEWTESTAGNKPADRRFLEASGPFKLLPGTVNKITVGVVWSRASSGGAERSLLNMLDADAKAQGLFNANFKIADGPRNPDVQIVELDQRLIISLNNTKLTEVYDQIEPTAAIPYRYKFEGYQIYQIKDNTVTVADLTDPNRAQLIAQVDIKNGVRDIVNTTYNAFLEASSSQKMVQGSDMGIRHTFEITTDVFNRGERLANNKPYYFFCLAYAYGKDAFDDTSAVKQRHSYRYLLGRKNTPNGGYTGIPRKSEPRYNGTDLRADVFETPKVKRLSGAGNGGVILDFAAETDVNEIFTNNGIINNPIYDNSRGPLKVRVYDPFRVPNKSFTFYFTDDTYNNPGFKRWKMVDEDGKIVYSDTTIDVLNEQIVPEYGFSISVDALTLGPGDDPDNNNNGLLDASIVYPAGSPEWFNPMPNDLNTQRRQNWIDPFNASLAANRDPVLRDQDPSNLLRNTLGGRFCPYKFVNRNTNQGPAITNTNAQGNAKNSLKTNITSIDLVLTKDESKWSQCIVVESGGKKASTEGSQFKGNLRMKDIGKGMGRGVFPGYAINMETGQRINLFFSEASDLSDPICKDMLFNPSNDTTNGFNGGKHYLYIVATAYDSCNALYQSLTTPSITSDPNTSATKINAYSSVGWVAVPLIDQNLYKSNGATEVRVRLRVAKPLTPFVTTTNANGGFPYYQFSTGDMTPVLNNKEVLKNALDLISVVPNPYYAGASYERSKTDTRVRITNLPLRATISIYTLAGDLVKRIEKDTEASTFVDWDLQNNDNVPISGGMYVIHVRARDSDGKSLEKTIKWFGVMRPTDLDNF